MKFSRLQLVIYKTFIVLEIAVRALSFLYPATEHLIFLENAKMRTK
jgi:hypothetical protein